MEPPTGWRKGKDRESVKRINRPASLLNGQQPQTETAQQQRDKPPKREKGGSKERPIEQKEEPPLNRWKEKPVSKTETGARGRTCGEANLMIPAHT